MAQRLLYLDDLNSNTNLQVTLTGPSGTIFSNQSLYNDATPYFYYYYSSTFNPIKLTPGSYTLTVTSSGATTGAYAFNLSDLATATTFTPSTAVSDTLNPADSTKAYKFAANAGSMYYFNAQTYTGSQPYWRLLDPYGNQVFDTSFGDQTVTISRTGTYTLLVEGYYNRHRHDTVCLQRLPGQTASGVALDAGHGGRRHAGHAGRPGGLLLHARRLGGPTPALP